ncbi:hypothetical protein AgCh_037681 [Apium graveolens]
MGDSSLVAEPQFPLPGFLLGWRHKLSVVVLPPLMQLFTSEQSVCSTIVSTPFSHHGCCSLPTDGAKEERRSHHRGGGSYDDDDDDDSQREEGRERN